jgi:hypothetical protein
MLIASTPPWHLWGNTELISVPPTGLAATSNVASKTLVRASYGRPEKWHFLFNLQLKGPVLVSFPGNTAFLDCTFDLILGVGRSAITLVNFAALQYDWGNGGNMFPTNQMWTQVGRIQESISATPSTDPPFRPDHFIAQDVTIVANLFYQTDVPGAAPIVAEVSGQISPATHVRPDWLVEGPPAEKFLGGETGAR